MRYGLYAVWYTHAPRDIPHLFMIHRYLAQSIYLGVIPHSCSGLQLEKQLISFVAFYQIDSATWIPSQIDVFMLLILRLSDLVMAGPHSLIWVVLALLCRMLLVLFVPIGLSEQYNHKAKICFTLVQCSRVPSCSAWVNFSKITTTYLQRCNWLSALSWHFWVDWLLRQSLIGVSVVKEQLDPIAHQRYDVGHRIAARVRMVSAAGDQFLI